MATKTKKRGPIRPRRVHPANERAAARRAVGGSFLWIALALLGLGGGLVVLFATRDERKAPAPPAEGLPRTSDYHSLLVAPENPNALWLGTHQGLYASTDGGRSWAFRALSGRDAMNLVRAGRKVLWVAGHNLLAKSTDGGKAWQDVRPSGLPSLDVHGFAIDPTNPRALFAAIAGQGLYRSNDGGNSFRIVSSEVGGAVMALAVTRSRQIFAGDMQRGLLISSDGGNTWHVALRAQLMGLAVNPRTPKTILGSGPGVLLSTDGGAHWRQPLRVDEGAGPVAWSESKPNVAYLVGFDRLLYRTDDGGRSWHAVRAGGGE